MYDIVLWMLESIILLRCYDIIIGSMEKLLIGYVETLVVMLAFIWRILLLFSSLLRNVHYDIVYYYLSFILNSYQLSNKIQYQRGNTPK